jgi:hypothetical protein
VARLIAVCGDVPAPADGAAFSECVEVRWVSDSSVTDLTPEEQAGLFGAVALFFAVIFVWRQLRKV